MSRVFGTSDWHLGHKAICKYRKQFKNITEHDQALIDNYKRVVGKRDTCYFFGDICFTDESLDLLRDLPGRKILIMGNHDGQNMKDKKRLWEVFDDIIASKSYKGVWLTHVPFHDSELRSKYCIHGHTHSASVDDSRYFNICVEKTDFTPILLKDVIEGLKEANPEYEKARLQKLEDRFSGKIEMDEM